MDIPTILYTPDGTTMDSDMFYPIIISFDCPTYKYFCRGDRLDFWSRYTRQNQCKFAIFSFLFCENVNTSSRQGRALDRTQYAVLVERTRRAQQFTNLNPVFQQTKRKNAPEHFVANFKFQRPPHTIILHPPSCSTEH